MEEIICRGLLRGHLQVMQIAMVILVDGCYTAQYICQNSLNCSFKIGIFHFIYKLYLSEVHKKKAKGHLIFHVISVNSSV